MERLYVEIVPSRIYCLLCLLIHVLAFGALWLSALPWYFVAGIAVPLVVSLAYHLRRFGMLVGDNSVIAMDCHQGVWRLKLAEGGWISVSINNTVTLTRYLVVMNFTDGGGGRYPVTLLPDSTSCESFRRTKVLLRLA